jgi:hypothetical protein
MRPWHEVCIDEDQVAETFPVVVEGMQERDEALNILRDGLVMYRQLRRGELTKD